MSPNGFVTRAARPGENRAHFTLSNNCSFLNKRSAREKEEQQPSAPSPSHPNNFRRRFASDKTRGESSPNHSVIVQIIRAETSSRLPWLHISCDRRGCNLCRSRKGVRWGRERHSHKQEAFMVPNWKLFLSRGREQASPRKTEAGQERTDERIPPSKNRKTRCCYKRSCFQAF